MPLERVPAHDVRARCSRRFNDLTEIRTNRLTAASAKIPIAMNVLLYTGALIMIGSVYLLPFDRFWLHATVTAAFAGAIAHILFLIYDLDNAFAGDYQVDKGPFEESASQFQALSDDACANWCAVCNLADSCDSAFS